MGERKPVHPFEQKIIDTLMARQPGVDRLVRDEVVETVTIQIWSGILDVIKANREQLDQLQRSGKMPLEEMDFYNRMEVVADLISRHGSRVGIKPYLDGVSISLGPVRR